MRWALRNEPFDPASTTLEQLAAAKRIHDLAVQIGAAVGIVAALIIYFVWKGFGYEHKWVEYTMVPAILIGGCVLYRLVYEFVIRFRP